MHITTALLTLIPTVLSHGLIQIPPSRAPGAATLEACGTGVVNQIKADNTSYVEALPGPASKDKAYNAAKCNLWLCKGLQYADNVANVQKFAPGQVVPIKVWLRIPHEGIANVSIVDTRSNKVLGSALKVWEKGYAPGRAEKDVPKDQKEFNVTIPAGIEEACGVDGNCVSALLFMSRKIGLIV